MHPLVRVSLLTVSCYFLVIGLAAQPVPESFFEAIGVRNIGPGTMSGRVTAIAVDESKSPRTLYIGTASGGIWKSGNEGTDWVQVFDTTSAHSIGALAVHPQNPDIVWAGTGEGNPRNSQSQGRGIFRSLDGGRTWQCMGLEDTRTIHRVILDPNDPMVVYAAAMGTAWGDTKARGVYKTTDGGKTWRNVLFVNERTSAAELIQDPRNPQKLFAAMWEYRRWPWFFKSGGEGSGLYMSVDGGENWRRLTDKDGLPKGELGRMGLAMSAADPQVVYALVEAKKNGLYKSVDGGFTWKLVQDENIGNRPFYYAEIHADPSNANRLYNLSTYVDVSVDGGKTFEQLMPAYGTAQGVHPDHHAWYVSPKDPNFLINGNDGGANISRDGGKTWRYIENIPVGQFYHIAVDNQVPYNVYGGLQDNGSYMGPSRVYNWGGIKNHDFQEIFFGDGFDVVPDPSDPAYAYAMSQGGNVGRVHLPTGDVAFLQPLHPEGTTLRFNWNAGIAADPHNPNGFYFGSQFLHYSPDHGQSWRILSPDLTTNDSTKQKANVSGGLSFDATFAENHTTILTITPSPLQKEVIWVGTDDGNVQLTRDGGKTWTNFESKLPGVPAGSWVQQITASKHTAGEAFVVVNDYRRDNWTPWLLRTTDYGLTWQNLVTPAAVDGYTLSFVQDPKAANLYFLGTEFGLYVSVDAGKTWTRWPKKKYPTVSTYDMVLQEAENDLVIGSFGRGIWIFDDVTPLRTLAQQGPDLLGQPLAVFPAVKSYRYTSRTPKGERFAGHAAFLAPNEPAGVPISFFVPEDKPLATPDAPKTEGKRKPKAYEAGATEKPTTQPEAKPTKPDTATIEIVNAQGAVIRTHKLVPTPGLNRYYWGYDAKGVRFPGSRKPKPSDPERGGGPTLLGVYTARVSYRGATATTSFEVALEPNLPYSAEQFNAAVEQELRLQDEIELTTALVDQLDEAKASITRTLGLLSDAQKADSAFKPLQDLAKAYQDSLKALRGLVIFDNDGKQGIIRGPQLLRGALSTAGSYMDNYRYGTTNQLADWAVAQAQAELRTVRVRITRFLSEEWPAFEAAYQAAGLSPVHPLPPLPDTN